MSTFRVITKYQERGFALLLGSLMSVVILVVAATVLNSTLKQTVLSEIALESERAFHAAYAGVECARFWNVADVWDEGNNSGDTITCGDVTDISVDDTSISTGSVGGGVREPADVTQVQINWNSSPNSPGGSGNLFELESYRMCTIMTVYKYYRTSGSPGNMDRVLPNITGAGGIDPTCPVGVECTVVHSKGYNRPCNQLGSLRTVERELTVRF